MSALVAAALWLVAPPLSAQTQDPEPGTDPSETDPSEAEGDALEDQATPEAPDRAAPPASDDAAPPVPAHVQAQQATSPSPAEVVPGALRAGWSWDLAVEGALGSTLEQADFAAFGRVRVGVFGLREPLIGAIGATLEAGHFGDVAVGLQGQLMHLWNGLGLSLGGAYSLDSYWMMHAALHYSVFGVEWQHRFVDGEAAKNALFGKITIPIGVIAYLL